MNDDTYADLIRRKLAELAGDGKTRMVLRKVVKVLAPLEAVCSRERCFESEVCSHLRVEVLYVARKDGTRNDLPFTAIFAPGDEPGEPHIYGGWA